MAPSLEELRKIVQESLADVSGRMEGAVSEGDAAILGNGQGLDSLGFVNFIVAVEERCQERFGIQVSLIDNAGGDTDATRFTSVESLASYLRRRLEA